MAFNGSGTYQLPAGQPVVTGTTISSSTHNTLASDLATALSSCIVKDGQQTPTANVKWGGFRLTNVGAATDVADAARASQVQNSALTVLASVAGTDTITGSAAITPAAYAAGQRFHFVPAGTNTGATTLNVSSLGAKNVFWNGVACVGGEIRQSIPVTVEYDGTQFNIVGNGFNAPFLDTHPVVVGGTDSTKKVSIEADNLTTATTRTLTVQDKNATLPALEDASLPWNCSLAASVAANALTIALKTRDGGDPSAGDPAFIPFRNATVATGDYSVLSLTAATSLVISSGSTLGTANSTAFRFWIVGFNDGGTFRLGVINCLSGTDIYRLSGFGIGSSTAEGGAGAADSAHVFYTGSAVTSVAYTVLGYLTYESGLAAAGTYDVAPTRVQLFGPGVPLPGQEIQEQVHSTGAVATGTTVLPIDDTIPQITEGDEYMTKAIIPSSAANVLDIEHFGYYAHNTTASVMAAAIFQDATAGALSAVKCAKEASADASVSMHLRHRMLAGTSSSTTITLRAGSAGAGTTTFNGAAGARQFGGVMGSFLSLKEVMA